MNIDRPTTPRAAIEAWQNLSVDRATAWQWMHEFGLVSATEPGAPAQLETVETTEQPELELEMDHAA